MVSDHSGPCGNAGGAYGVPANERKNPSPGAESPRRDPETERTKMGQMPMRAVTTVGLTMGLMLGLAGAAHAQDQQLFALSGPTAPRLWTLDPDTTAEVTSEFVTGAQAIFCGITFDASGTMYTIDGFNDGFDDRLFTIDPLTGAGTIVGDTGQNWNFRSIAYDATTDTLYAARDSVLFTVNRDSGLVTQVATIAGAGLDQLTALAIDADGRGWGSDIGDTSVFSIDLATGQATRVGDAFPGTRNWFNDLTFGPDGTLYAAREQGGGIFTIDTATGQATLFRPSRAYQSLSFTLAGNDCPADIDGDGSLTLFDFLEFQNLFAAMDPRADFDGDGDLTLFDFLDFQNAFAQGCE